MFTPVIKQGINVAMKLWIWRQFQVQEMIKDIYWYKFGATNPLNITIITVLDNKNKFLVIYIDLGNERLLWCVRSAMTLYLTKHSKEQSKVI